MPYNPEAIANYFWNLAEAKGEKLSPMKVQKLVYYSRLVSRFDRPTVDRRANRGLEIRPGDPVAVPGVRHYGNAPITAPLSYSVPKGKFRRNRETEYQEVIPALDDQPEEAEEIRKLLDRVWGSTANIPRSSFRMPPTRRELPGIRFSRNTKERFPGEPISRARSSRRILELWRIRRCRPDGAKGSKPVDVNRIVDPGISPNELADKLTEAELNKASRRSDRPTPGDRHADAVATHLNDLFADRDRQRVEIARLQRELDELHPKLTALEAFSAALAGNVFSTVLIIVGGSLISGAGYVASETGKIIILTAGVVSLFLGIVFQMTATWQGSLFRQASPTVPLIPRANLLKAVIPRRAKASRFVNLPNLRHLFRSPITPDILFGRTDYLLYGAKFF